VLLRHYVQKSAKDAAPPPPHHHHHCLGRHAGGQQPWDVGWVDRFLELRSGSTPRVDYKRSEWPSPEGPKVRVQHYVQKSAQDVATPAITFTATTTASGSVLVGSSREMSGFQDDLSEAVVQAILFRAAKFVPSFASLTPQDCLTR